MDMLLSFSTAPSDTSCQILVQLFLMPRLAPITGEEAILSLSCIAGFISLQSIVSKQVGPNEQGIAQGCIAGISSFGNILSPLIYTPLTDSYNSQVCIIRSNASRLESLPAELH
ncbi:hypothetical protein H5410_052686 [Solanum commersonii]|uniref:Uncharacterized protein n=1 Tax=Solanum commersonii TaxID=4109 RepID=A0A9J5X1S3_SOLCO|nr:hypothetical protein H5410_052686 [Solanum commersonii]